MKKITDFIVEKRYLVFILVLILTGVSILVSSKVKINYDISKYLPSSSETRIGMDIMDSQFKSDTSTLNVMVKDLNSAEKEEACNFLHDLNDVSDVKYDNTEEYNKDNFTFYTLTVDAKADSKIAKSVFQKITKHFGDQLVDTSGDVANHNKTVLPFYIVVLAVVSALIILIIMCESYLEPFLFLISILIAVFLNKGTNIIFNNVSNITDSIAAILQMALSMDYSIMLMNRYRQERVRERDKTIAMKKALHNAFGSISSSSITTIVGLLALVFMSFTIGRDLGLVLAKGVLLSLFSIFTCLPALILMFDSLIEKTAKKSPIFELKAVGKVAYKSRYIALFMFITIFIVSYFLKGNLGILYTSSEADEIDEVFRPDNQIAIIYPNESEKYISDYCSSLEGEKKVKEVLCYGNTINLPLKYNELNKKLADFDSQVDVEDYLLKLIYYHYYNREENERMTIEEMLKFIKNDVYNNEKMKENIDLNTRENIDRLTNFVDKSEIQKKRTSKEIAETLNIPESRVNDLFIYYHSKDNSTKMTLSQFIDFMNKTVLVNEKYSDSVNDSTRNNLSKISTFTDKNVINSKLSAKKMSKVFGMTENKTEKLYTYYKNSSEISEKLSIYEFSNFVINNVLNNKDYFNLIDAGTKQNIEILNNFSNEKIIQKSASQSDLAKLFSMNEEDVKKIFLLAFGGRDNGSEYTINEFVTKVMYLQNLHYLDGYDLSGIIALSQNDDLMASDQKFTATSLADFINVENEKIYYLYALIDVLNGKDKEWKLTPYQFVDLILKNENITSNLNDETLNNLKKIYFIMNSTLKNQKYNYEEMSNNLVIDKNITKSIYSLYTSKYMVISPYQFVSFILNHQNDSLLKDNLNKSTLNELTTLNKMMNSIMKNKSYSQNEMASLLKVEPSSLSLIYSLYDVDVNNNEIEISYKDFISFLVNDVMKDEKYRNGFNDVVKNKLERINIIINNSLKNKKYDKDEVYEELSSLSNDLDKKMIDLVYLYYGSEENYQEDYKLTIEQFVKYLNDNILKDERFDNYIDEGVRSDIVDALDRVDDVKEQLVGSKYSRIVLNTRFDVESKETFAFIDKLENDLNKKNNKIYIIGDSPMAKEMSRTFEDELNLITVLTMIFIFVVVAVTFKSILIPIVLVLLIQCAVFLTMGILSFSGSVYFISILIVQSILMGATIDYAILYTSYYLEARQRMGIKESIISSYNNSIHTILTSASILIIVTLIVGNFASLVAAKICMTLSKGCLCSSLLIILLLPAVLSAFDKLIMKNKYKK